MKKALKRKIPFEFSSDVLDLMHEKKLPVVLRGLWFRSWLSTGHFPRVLPKKFKFTWGWPDYLTPVAQGFKLEGEYADKVRIHKKRLDTRMNAYFGIIMPISYVVWFGVFILFGYMTVYQVIKNNDLARLNTSFFQFFLYSIPTVYLLTFFLARLFFLMVDRLFADSICVAVSVGVLVELVSPQVLDNPYRRRILLAYINDLARYTQLLSLTFTSPSEEENEMIRKRFRAIEAHIREQARMAIFPTEKTLDDLRGNFMALTKIFISGRYGDFSYAEEESKLTPVKPLTWYEVLGKWVGRLVGLGLPAAALYFLVVRPEYFSNLPVNPNTISIVALAWLALSLDSILGLGVTAKMIATAKEFKNLV